MKKYILCLMLGTVAINNYGVEVQTILDTNAMVMNSAMGENWLVFGMADVKIGISQRTPKIRFEVTPRLQSIGTNLYLSLYRGFVRAQISDHFRLTIGKAPISWGEGNYYNAGDLFYSSSALAQGKQSSVVEGGGSVALSNDILRDNARWLANFYIPIGLYGYIEAIATTPNTGVEAIDLTNPTNPLAGFDYRNSGLGSRFGYKIGDVQLQLGALYLGDDRSFRSFASLSGGIANLIDWNIATRTSFNTTHANSRHVAESWEISGGLSLPYTFENGQFLSVGIETIFRPFKRWDRITDWTQWIPDNGAIPGHYADVYNYEQYGNELYFGITYRPISIITLVSRVVYLPIDQSAQLFTMLIYSPIQNLSIYLQNATELGHGSALLSYQHPQSIFVSLGLKYVL